MATQVLSSSPLLAEKYSVVGKYAETDDGLIGHVAMIATKEPTDIYYGDSVEVWQMGPPLIADARVQRVARNGTQCEAHVLGSVDWPENAFKRMRNWRRDLAGRIPFKTKRHIEYYIIHPAILKGKISSSDIQKRTRFSCAGFVLACYRVGLLDEKHIMDDNAVIKTGEDVLPKVDIEYICKAYPFIAKRIKNPEFRKDMGLSGDGPWPILLAGYILRAMEQGDLQARPYQPANKEEACFPKVP